MADLTFNTTAGQTIDREQVIAYLNTGTAQSPTWSPLGRRVEDSSASFDWGDESIRDILGNTWGTMRKPIITQTFDPSDLDSEDAALVKIWNLAVKDQDARALAAQDMLIVHFYAGLTAAPFAERYSSCMVIPTGLGGAGGGNVTMPINVTYGGTRTVGTASINSSTGEVTFNAGNSGANGVELTEKTITVSASNGTHQLTAITVPAGETVTWTSSDTDKATVSSGLVTGKAQGNAIITASVTIDGVNYTDTCTVIVRSAS